MNPLGWIGKEMSLGCCRDSLRTIPVLSLSNDLPTGKCSAFCPGALPGRTRTGPTRDRRETHTSQACEAEQSACGEQHTSACCRSPLPLWLGRTGVGLTPRTRAPCRPPASYWRKGITQKTSLGTCMYLFPVFSMWIGILKKKTGDHTEDTHQIVSAYQMSICVHKQSSETWCWVVGWLRCFFFTAFYFFLLLQVTIHRNPCMYTCCITISLGFISWWGNSQQMLSNNFPGSSQVCPPVT